MRCPYCDNKRTCVLNSRVVEKDRTRVRKRVCESCGQTFMTDERVRAALPLVVKRDERRESFSLNKLRRGIETALHKRPVSADSIDEIVDGISYAIVRQCRSEVKSSDIGDAVMHHLADLDSVAYIRFASVYRSFAKPEQFGEIVGSVKQSAAHLSGQRSLPFGLDADSDDREC